MIEHRSSDISRTAAIFLILGSVACFIGAGMYVYGRGGLELISLYHAWVRGFIVTAPILTAVGLLLLEDIFHASNGRALARIGASSYFFAAILVVSGELLAFPLGWEKASIFMVVYTVMAYLAQASVGGALLQSRVTPLWIGWATIVWNLAWLLVFVVSGWTIGYIPLVHHFMPLIIGIALLRKAS
jgi:hypothetical protein